LWGERIKGVARGAGDKSRDLCGGGGLGMSKDSPMLAANKRAFIPWSPVGLAIELQVSFADHGGEDTHILFDLPGHWSGRTGNRE
jgi:hypothetical protein